MTKQTNATLFFGLTVCIILAVLYSFLAYNGLKGGIVQNVLPPNDGVIDTAFFDESILRELQAKNINGSLPITVDPADLGKTSPF